MHTIYTESQIIHIYELSYMFQLLIPEDSNLLLKHLGEFMCKDDLCCYINCVHLQIYFFFQYSYSLHTVRYNRPHVSV